MLVSERGGDKRRLENAPELPLTRIPSVAALERDKEPVVPRRVVANVALEQPIHVAQLAVPHALALFGRRPRRAGPRAVRVEVAQDPLAVGPRVVVLGVDRERLGGEVELARGVVEGKDDGAAVLPGRRGSTGRVSPRRARSWGEPVRERRRTRPGTT